MRIGIEAQRIFRSEKHGMDFVILEVLRQLQLKNDEHEYFVFVAPGEDHCLRDTSRIHIIEIACPTYLLWEQWALPRAAHKWKIELLHCTSNTAPIYCSIPLVLTLHDIIFLQFSKSKEMSRYQQMGWYYRRWNVPRILNRCHQILTVSNTEKTNILQHFPELQEHLTVVHNGYSSCYQLIENISHITQKYIADSQYLLFLGSTDPRKNTDGVLHAYYEYLNCSKRQLKLIVTGLSKEYVENRLIDMGLKIKMSNFVFTGYVPSSDLPALYNGAYAFLFPSLLEGFGIPVLEAMACGTPVITSNCSSLPEVAGEGAILVSPTDIHAIADALVHLETDETWYQQQVTYGLEHIKQFSWKSTAEKYVAIYDKILQS